MWNTTSPIKQKSFRFALNAIFKTRGMFNKSAFYLYGNTAIHNWTWHQPKYEEPNIGFWLRARKIIARKKRFFNKNVLIVFPWLFLPLLGEKLLTSLLPFDAKDGLAPNHPSLLWALCVTHWPRQYQRRTRFPNSEASMHLRLAMLQKVECFTNSSKDIFCYLFSC